MSANVAQPTGWGESTEATKAKSAAYIPLISSDRVIAVISVAIGDGLEVALLGLARIALPRPQVALVSIELGLVVVEEYRRHFFGHRTSAICAGLGDRR